MPCRIELTDGSTISYTYSAEGEKLRRVRNIGGYTSTTDYCGDVIYENHVPVKLLTEAGYITLSDGKYHYFITDHLGNNRVVASQDGKAEEVNDYYPFGALMSSTASNTVQPYKYNGKELDRTKNLNLYDYGARQYDPLLGRWHAVDPLAEKYYGVSPYAYCDNNPVARVDVDGADWYQHNTDGSFFWKEGHNELDGYTNIGSTASIPQADGSYLNAYQNASVKANGPANAFALISVSVKLQREFLGKNSPLSDNSKSELFNALVCKGNNDIGIPVGKALTITCATIFTSHIASVAANAVTRYRFLSLVQNEGKGFDSFYELKKYLGPAGKGKAWHHIVEQIPAYIEKFGAKMIHNTKNVIRIDHGKGSIHAKISGYYSSNQNFTGNLTVRKWLQKENFEKQFKFGLKQLDKYGITYE